MPKALIFDFDGLILDTETAVYEGWREIYVEHGHPLPLETWAQCVGSDFGLYDPAADLESLIGKLLDWPFLHARRRQRVAEILQGKDALPGVRARLLEAADRDIPCAVASSSPHEWVDKWLKQLGLWDYFANVTCLEDTGKVKPDPSLFLHAASKLEVDPGDAVVFEDSLNGLRAAHAAGMRCVVVPCAVTSHLTFDGAWRQLASLEEITVPDLFLYAA
jgi:HAD superfamily hydrolase (TIGR01509 family)